MPAQPMTVARTSHDPPLTRPATAPPSLLGGSLLVSALAQFSLSADTVPIEALPQMVFTSPWRAESAISRAASPHSCATKHKNSLSLRWATMTHCMKKLCHCPWATKFEP
jgi:hypothetical protein